MNETMKKAGALASGLVLASSTALMVAPVVMTAVAEPAPQVTAASPSTKVAGIQGEFSYTQDKVTPGKAIVAAFMKAGTLCASLGDYHLDELSPTVTVGGDVTSGFSATVDEMGEQSSTTGMILACSCASNVAGGGIAVNADVSGVTIADIAALAGAL